MALWNRSATRRNRHRSAAVGVALGASTADETPYVALADASELRPAGFGERFCDAPST